MRPCPGSTPIFPATTWSNPRMPKLSALKFKPAACRHTTCEGLGNNLHSYFSMAIALRYKWNETLRKLCKARAVETLSYRSYQFAIHLHSRLSRLAEHFTCEHVLQESDHFSHEPPGSCHHHSPSGHTSQTIAPSAKSSQQQTKQKTDTLTGPANEGESWCFEVPHRPLGH